MVTWYALFYFDVSFALFHLISFYFILLHLNLSYFILLIRHTTWLPTTVLLASCLCKTLLTILQPSRTSYFLVCAQLPFPAFLFRSLTDFTIKGNHEYMDNNTDEQIYRGWFRGQIPLGQSSGSQDPEMWHSYDIGEKLHFIGVSY